MMMKKQGFQFAFVLLVALAASLSGFSQAVKPKFETCVLHHCKNSQLQVDELRSVSQIEVHSAKGALLEVVSYTIEVIFHDDVLSGQAKGAKIPSEIKTIFGKLDSGSIVKIKQVKAKEKSGTLVSAPDLTLKIF